MTSVTRRRTVLRLPAVAVFLVAALALAGCGGGDDSTSSGSSSSSSSSASSASSVSSSSSASSSSSSAAGSFALSGTVAGLTTGSLVLSNNGAQITVNAPTASFSFGAVLNAGSAYNVSVTSAPSGYTCSVANGTGTAGTANIGNVVVTCSLASYTLGGTISGLTSSGLVVANGSATLSVAANATTFTFLQNIAFGSGYNVTVQTQPTGRTCAVTSGAGTMPAGNVVNVSINCQVASYTLGGAVSGLTTGGLVLANGSSTLSVASNATTFTFAQNVAFGSTYNVTVQTQPTGLTCSISNGTGTMPASNVTSVVVTCSGMAYTIGGNVGGLNSSGLVLANGGSTLSVASGSTTFTFPGTVASGGSYAVTVQTQPAGKNCSIANGTGTVAASNVTSIAVTCASTSYTLGGTISGLNLGGLVLANGADSLSVAANATSFTMPTSVAFNGSYNIAISSQPSGLTCSVSNGSGTMPANNVTSVSVSCGVVVSSGGWTWLNGPQKGGTWAFNGQYGTKGQASPSNYPGSRFQNVGWKDGSGNLWMFSGYGSDANGSYGRMDDVWKFNVSSNQWTWVSGQNAAQPNPVFGTQGSPSTANTPGGRSAGAAWSNGSDAYVFGGIWINGFYELMNDLWKYNMNTGEWTWLKGSTTSNVGGSCSGYGVANGSNTPGARKGAGYWNDGAGNLWLFGGIGNDCSGAQSVMNDLWKYSISGNTWTLVNGSPSGTPSGNYGTQGVPSGSNSPGGRQEPEFWKDSSGNLWVFGGLNAAGNQLNDLWRYNPSANQWTWMGGSTGTNALGSYGTQGVQSGSNMPGARRGGAGFFDGTYAWVFGGFGWDAFGNKENLNDLWRYQPSTGQWTWMSGSNTTGSSGNYGSLGTPSSSNAPPARNDFAFWTDNSGHLWVGQGEGQLSSTNHTADLFKY